MSKKKLSGLKLPACRSLGDALEGSQALPSLSEVSQSDFPLSNQTKLGLKAKASRA